jgi:hypothetical protein
VDATRPLAKPKEKFEKAKIPAGEKTADSIVALKKRLERRQ